MVTKAHIALKLGGSLSSLAVAVASPAYAQVRQAAAQATTTQPSDAAAKADIGDIVVTAQRRSERLQDVPLAVTAVPAEVAVKSGLRSMVDVKLVTPGVDLTSSTGFVMLTMRGIGVPFVSPGLESSVAIYADDTYLPRTSGLNSLMDLVDPGSIEIIRGPQGTLYGRNATGGVLRLNSANPTDRFEGRVLAEYGRFDHKQFDGMLNIPLSDTLAVRFAGRYLKEDGYVKNIDGQTLPEANNYTLRGRLRWNPSSSVEIVGGVEWQHSKANGFNDQLGLGAPSCYVCQSTGDAPRGFYQAAVTIVSPYENHALRADLHASVRVSDFDIKSTTTYFSNNSFQNADNDFTPIDMFRYNVQRSGGRTFGQELQVGYDAGGPLKLIFATNYIKDKGWIDFSLEGAAFAFALPTGAYPKNSNTVDTETLSAMLEGTYQVTNEIKITAGGRYTHDKRDQFVTNNAGFQLFGTPASFSSSSTFSAFTPRFVLAWDNGPTNIYYSYTRGFKAGGVVSPSPTPGRAVDPEKVFNHEIGWKQRALGGKLNFSLSAFYYKNKGLQQQVVDVTTGGTITQNAGSAEGYGAEFEAHLRPLEGLQVGASVGYLHAQYVEYKNAAIVCFDPTGTASPSFPGATLYACRTDLSGTNVPHAPRLTLSANASYTFPIGDWSADISGIAQYRSSYLFWPGAGGQLNFDRQSGYTVANFSGYVSPPGNRLRVGVYIDNAFNERYAAIRSTIAPWGAAYDAAKPRTYGVRMEYKF